MQVDNLSINVNATVCPRKQASINSGKIDIQTSRDVKRTLSPVIQISMRKVRQSSSKRAVQRCAAK